jgi:HD superfamily phosphohydrolase
MAALCHDIGHLPFSHAAETELLPGGWTHENLTVELNRSKEMREHWEAVTPPLRPEDIVKLAVGPGKLPEVKFTNWEAILSEIIVGNAFGVDRMDYLLRDSLHAGVQYGKFDHNRLVQTLRILPRDQESQEPMLGVEKGGLHSAESLLLAQYSMLSQIYLHPVRRAYDLHLKDFLRAWLPNGMFPPSVSEFLEISDIEVLAAMLADARQGTNIDGHESAKRIIERQHFKSVYSRNPIDLQINPSPGLAISTALIKKYGEDNVKSDNYIPGGGVFDFPVEEADKRIVSSWAISDILNKISIDFVFVEPTLRVEAMKWINLSRNEILASS